MMIQLIDKNKLRFRLNNTEYDFVKPKYLMPVNSLKLIEAKVKGSTMVFNINNTTISYNQIKRCIQQ